MQEKVSVVIPTYNREKTIARAVRSILAQTYENYEVLVVDDGSTDSTRKIVEGLGDDRIRYIDLGENSGASHARNVGIQMAECDYIAFLDSDDEWLPEKLSKQMDAMRRMPENVGFVYCRMKRADSNEKKAVCPEQDMPVNLLAGNLFVTLMKKNIIGTPTVLARKKCLEQAGGFDESLRCIEDWEMFLRIAQAWEIGFIEDILVTVHATAGSVSYNIRAYIEARCYMISKYWRRMEDENILEGVMQELLMFAHKYGYYREAKKMLLAALKA